jgi:Xaa-Pro aminopeptidase
MFNSEIYINRRSRLASIMKSGMALFVGNVESPMNYPANAYHFRQDSDFLYFFGIDLPGLTGIIDFNSGESMIFGNDVDLDDIIWMGPQPTISELSEKVGVTKSFPFSKLDSFIREALSKGRMVHFLPPYRAESKMTLGLIFQENPCQMKSKASAELIKAVISLRSIKEKVEIDEIEKAGVVAYEMQVTAMKMCKPGVSERDIFGTLEGISWSKGYGPSFPTILSINGQTLHNHSHGNILSEGRMMVCDCGAESLLHYASDLTRTTPVGGKFNTRQKEIYEIVLKANTESIALAKPGMSNKDLHLNACKIIAAELKTLGIMKGDPSEAVEAGAHAMFLPHGLGHMLGMDVHDMEGLGEDFVGYNDGVKRSDQFGLAFLRFALPYKPGHIFTVEPGIYFIPELINLWKAEKKFEEFINYNKLETYKDFGGIRIEDDLLITSDGSRILGPLTPKTVKDVEETCA